MSDKEPALFLGGPAHGRLQVIPGDYRYWDFAIPPKRLASYVDFIQDPTKPVDIEIVTYVKTPILRDLVYFIPASVPADEAVLFVLQALDRIARTKYWGEAGQPKHTGDQFTPEPMPRLDADPNTGIPYGDLT